jgi:hypothetical protein
MERHLRKAKYAMITSDDVQLHGNYCDCNQLRFITKAYLGTILPIQNEEDVVFYLLLPQKGENGFLKLRRVMVEKKNATIKPFELNKENAAVIIDRLIDKPYGWDGYQNNRDCAQLLKDYFAVFGVHLPIFSADQIKTGRYVSLENLNNTKKEAKILTEAKPFSTILYRKGHVVLYLGKVRGKPAIFHSVWGIKLFDKGDEYRFIIGKSAITSLEFGKELKGFDKEKSNLLSKLSAMSIVKE